MSQNLIKKPILVLMKILKENADKWRNFIFSCSEINVILNFALEKCMTYYISIKKVTYFLF